MKTTHDVEQTLYQVLLPSLGALITGGVYLRERPASGKEDIVINTLPISGDQWQGCTANVNIHVPPITVTLLGQAQKRPDTARMKALAAEAVSVLEQYTQAYRYYLRSQQDIRDPQTGEYYTNIKIDFTFFNL